MVTRNRFSRFDGCGLTPLFETAPFGVYRSTSIEALRGRFGPRSREEKRAGLLAPPSAVANDRMSGLETNAEADPELLRRGVRQTIQCCAKDRAVIPIHSLNWSRRERVEWRVLGGGVDRRQDRRVDARLGGCPAVLEDVAAAPAQLELVEQVDDLSLNKDLQGAHFRAARKVAAVVNRQVGPLLRLRPEGIARRVKVDRVSPGRRVDVCGCAGDVRPWIEAVEVPGRVQVGRSVRHAAFQRLEQADDQTFRSRDTVSDPESCAMTLIHLQVAFGVVPRFLLIFGVLSSAEVHRAAADVFPLEVAPCVRQRVLTANF